MTKKQTGFGVIGLFLLLILITASVVGYRIYKSHKTVAICSPSNYSTSCGIPLSSIPEQLRDRAKNSGIYCASWAAKPGEAAPDWCAKVSKQ